LKNYILILTASLLLFSCKKEDSVTCTTCNSPQTTSFEICRDSNGNASVNGENTGTNYDVYITGLEEAGATCGN
jgi:hypothetical protein|tara:strand:+ start:214 stop:435 length:222 start_codon:yes stop_codon:yes gene_type:complete